MVTKLYTETDERNYKTVSEIGNWADNFTIYFSTVAVSLLEKWIKMNLKLNFNTRHSFLS